MPDYNEYAQRVVNAINQYGETIKIKYRISNYDPIKGETYTWKTLKNYRVFIRPTDQKDWEQLPEGLKIKDVRKVYFTKPFPVKEVLIERQNDDKLYEVVVPPEDNYFEGKNFYYKCFIAIKEVQSDTDK